MKKLSSVLIKIIVSSLFLLNIAHAKSHLSLPENHAVNGGLTIIPIDINDKPKANYKDKPISVIKSPNPNQWLLIVGIPLDNKRSIENINIEQPIKAKVPFHVSKKHYRTQYLTIKNKRKVDPYAKDRSRINNEKRKMKEIFAQYSQQNPFDEAFIAPSHGPISSLFGLNRVYNKKPRAPHSGLDIASPAKSIVKATNKGTVVETGNYFFTGNTVIIDHGQGVFSLYAHLNNINTKKGKKIQRGEPVGTVGKTGRVTGPHLHWTMVMNQNLVDPLLFVSARNIRKGA